MDALKAKYTEAKGEYEALVAKQAGSEAELLTAYPEARAILGDVELPKRRGRVPKAAGAKAGKAAGKTLRQEQAEKVLAAMGSTFIMGEFRKKVGETFPGYSMKGSLDLIADKIKVVGGRAMGTKYKKI